jgi:beta-lactamase regulating signal transducer with metallopeptidase domain
MGISVLSWIAPLITIQKVKEQDIASSKVLHFANFISENNSLLEQEIIENTANYTWDNLLIIIGIIISLFFIVRFVKSLWDIRKLIRLYPLIELKGMNLVMTDVKGTPFSFFKYIFWNTAIDLNGDVGKKILSHEVVHIEEKHSVDKLLIELQLLIGWFNPIVWLIRNELYLIHEFIADQKSIENQDSGVLAKLLLASAYPKQQHLLTNTFFYSPIKRRLTMLTKSTNTKYSYLRRVMVLPILIATVFLVSIKVNASDKIEKTAKEIQNTIDLLVSDTTKPKKITPPTPPTPPNPSQAKPDHYINGAKIEFKGDIDTAVGDKKTPLYIIDGVPLKSSIEVSKLNEEEFESMSVLRNPLSISQYGDEGKNGVILITTKTGLKGNLQKKSDEIKVFEYSAKEGLDGDVYYKKIEDGTVNGYGNNKAETNVPVKVTNVPIKVTNVPVKVTNVPIKVTNVPVKVTNVPKSDKITVTSKTSLDTIVFSSPSGSKQVKFSNVTLTTKDKQKVLDALEKKANVVIEKKTENGTEKYIIVDSKAGKAAIKPAFYLDGVKITENEMKAISPNDIESINILKGENAMKKYPKDGKSGVVEIKVKPKN